MASSAQLEREAENTRAQLAQTLAELRERITPGQLVDQAVDYAKDSGGGMFVRNLGRQTTANPLPVALIGAGVAWLMLANRGPSTTAASINRAAQTAIDRAQRSMRETGEQIKESDQNASTRAEETAHGAGARASAAASSVGDTAASASGFGRRTADASRDLLQFCKSQPLVLAGLGMALGAIIGALIPPTDTEDALMGEKSDQLKDQARDIAEDQIRRAESTAESAVTAPAFNETEAEFQFEDAGANSGVPAETSLVPEAEHGTEQRGSGEAAGHEK
jgi:hypothetical protein